MGTEAGIGVTALRDLAFRGDHAHPNARLARKTPRIPTIQDRHEGNMDKTGSCLDKIHMA